MQNRLDSLEINFVLAPFLSCSWTSANARRCTSVHRLQIDFNFQQSRVSNERELFVCSFNNLIINRMGHCRLDGSEKISRAISPLWRVMYVMYVVKINNVEYRYNKLSNLFQSTEEKIL